MYTETGVAGVGNEGIESWLQYALRTYGMPVCISTLSPIDEYSMHLRSPPKPGLHSQSIHNYS